MRSKTQILSKLRADGHITDEEYKMLEQEPTDDATLKDIFCMGCEYKEQESRLGNVLKENEEGILADNRLMEVSGMSIEELTDAFTKGYRLVSPDGKRVTRVTIDEARIVFQMGKEEPCGDCVNRQAVLELVADYDLSMGQVVKGIHALPPVTPQPQPKTGHWIVDGSVDCYLDRVRCHCSECGKKKEFPADYDHIKQELSISYKNPEFIDNYCPNCGAKMQEVEE